MKIAIIGAGAVGGYFGALLSEAGQDVTLVARGRTFEKLQAEGMRISDGRGERSVAIPVVPSAAQLDVDTDVVLMATKALGNATSARELLNGLPTRTLVATVQNSVEAPDAVAAVVGSQKVLPGVVRGFFVNTGPASVEFHGGPLAYNVGTWDGRNSEIVDTLIAALNIAGIEATEDKNVWVDLWEKAMFVTTFGALGALVGQPLGVLRTRLRGSLEAMMREVAEVARASGVDLPADAVERAMVFADRMPEESTSSMQRDITSGADSELDAQVGAICRAGNRFGVDTRLHDLVLDGLRLGNPGRF